MYYSSGMSTAVNNALNQTGDVRASTTALARGHLLEAEAAEGEMLMVMVAGMASS